MIKPTEATMNYIDRFINQEEHTRHTKPIPYKGESFTVNITTNTETILQFIDEYRNLLDKYGLAADITDDQYLIVDIKDFMSVDIKPVPKRGIEIR